MSLIQVTDPREWDGFIASQPWSQFTQSWAWGEFRISQGQAVERLASAHDDGSWAVAAQFVHYAKPIVGGYWYAPRGPVMRAGEIGRAGEIMGQFMNELSKRGLPRRSLFWRIEPLIENSQFTIHNSQLARSHAYMPASTLLVDLTKTEEQMLSEMHEKTRYNIRVAERHGVTVRVASTDEDVESFLELNEETARRDRFTSQPAAYIRRTHDFLSPRNMAAVRLAEKDGKLLAASLEISFGDTVTYLYGASSSSDRNVMAPYALHWSAIKSAKASGHGYYDFHGVNPEDRLSPYFKASWEGLTRFKLGWGGERRDLTGTWELPWKPILYRAFRLVSSGL